MRGVHARARSGNAYLHVKVLGGRAFADYVARRAAPHEQLQLCAELFGQRLNTPPVPASAEPAFLGEAWFELPPPVTAEGVALRHLPHGPGLDPLHLLSLRQGLHLAVVQALPMSAADVADRGAEHAGLGPGSLAIAQHAAQLSQQRVVVAMGNAEWRAALVRRGRVTVSVQLGAGPGTNVGMPATSAPAGVVNLQLELRPQLAAPLDESLLKSQQRAEHARDADTMTQFVSRAKVWWGEYVQQNLSFKTRPIKLLATAEDGSQYPACCFIKPLQLGRLLATPHEASRFVSLLRRREDLGLLPTGGQAEVMECWCSLHTVLASGTATKEEMALLLCGLLLGFGLDAWVVVGRLLDGSGHMWVLTRGPLASPSFWEPSTGVRYSITDVDTWPYLSIGCAFNHQRLFANQQADDSAFGTAYVLEDASLWREYAMPQQDVPTLLWSPLQLQPTAVDACALEQHLEGQLKAALAAHRGSALGLGVTAWDDQLGQLLMPALAAYEYEAVHSEVAPGNEEFQQAIRRAVPLGWVFKGFPQHHAHASAGLMRKALLEEEQVLDICSTSTAASSFALRVKVSVYPEGRISTWLMVATKFLAALG